ncbi:MauE/DoxX family redox-associated membrane protein [Enhygromyxa salina]|uniref:Methylamine utilization protein MauE n=1 Tax=Enhygromyxa salina TaxID=215803 RepID=A0A2S9YI94_9BACT|nr:MauE/DoxX family redox-associated membrane protein [Enhygromyxa salina]PRQ04834.1 Methylamine utilization protein MauE [Enhygromyxa salina]
MSSVDQSKQVSASGREAPPRWMILASWPARLIAGGVFIYAGVLKLIDPATLAQDIANYQAFPYWTWNLAAAVVPIAELLGGLALITGFKRRAGSLVLGALTVAFIGLILSVIVRGIDLSCGCFGEATQASAVGWPLLLRDVALLAAIVVAYLPPEPRSSSAKRLAK